MKDKVFKSELEFYKAFSTEEKCRKYLEYKMWNGIPCCPFCSSTNVCRFTTDTRIFKCREKVCRKKFSVTVGTVMENTKIPLQKWFLAIYLIANHSKGISSLQLMFRLKVTLKTAWFLTHRIREMFKDNSGSILGGIVEVDETFVGGTDKNRHEHKKKGNSGGKTMVIGAFSRGGEIRLRASIDKSKDAIEGFVSETVELGSKLMTDESHSYKSIGKKYEHFTINHREKEFVRKEDKRVHTNSIEGIWAILKRQVYGIHHYVSPKHLQRYCDEVAHRCMKRNFAQDEMFSSVLGNCIGRLTYQNLIANHV